jgi:hypothetical protein
MLFRQAGRVRGAGKSMKAMELARLKVADHGCTLEILNPGTHHRALPHPAVSVDNHPVAQLEIFRLKNSMSKTA